MSDEGNVPRLNRNDYRTLTLAALGGALEFYDFIIFVFFAVAIAQLFFPADMPEWLRTVQTYGIFAAGYLARPLGGIIMAHFGDLFGRKRMFMLSIMLMTVPTLVIGLLPTYRSSVSGRRCCCWPSACCRVRRSAAKCRGPGCS